MRYGRAATLHVQFSTAYCSRVPLPPRDSSAAISADYAGVRHVEIDLTNQPTSPTGSTSCRRRRRSFSTPGGGGDGAHRRRAPGAHDLRDRLDILHRGAPMATS